MNKTFLLVVVMSCFSLALYAGKDHLDTSRRQAKKEKTKNSNNSQEEPASLKHKSTKKLIMERRRNKFGGR